MSKPLWSGRFDSAPDPAAFDFGVSFPFDRRLFEDDVTGSLAWAEALARAGVLDAADSKAIAEGLTAILEQGRRDPSWVTGDVEDVHSFVERELVSRIGDAGRRLHTGRSRNEQVSVDLRLYLRRRIPLLQEKLRATIAAFADQAEKAGDALMPSYTHLRRAMPVLVSHFLLSHAAALRRDCGRLEAAREEANALPLGSGAIAGTGYAVDTTFLADRLGFSRVVTNSMDSSSDRDFAVVAPLMPRRVTLNVRPTPSPETIDAPMKTDGDAKSRAAANPPRPVTAGPLPDHRMGGERDTPSRRGTRQDRAHSASIDQNPARRQPRANDRRPRLSGAHHPRRYRRGEELVQIWSDSACVHLTTRTANWRNCGEGRAQRRAKVGFQNPSRAQLRAR